MRAIAKEAGIRGLACVTTGLANEIADRHDANPAARAVLAHVLTAGALMGALLKVQQRVAVKLEGNGPLGRAIVEADSYGRVRGYTAVSQPQLDVTIATQKPVQAIGNEGVLTVVKDLRLKELYEGYVPLHGETVGEALTYYLNQSEQIPSVVATGVRLDENGRILVAGGLLLQSMPPDDGRLLHQLADQLQELPPVDALLAEGKTPENILKLAFGEVDYKVLEERPLEFHCTCSRERTEQALISLGRTEIEALLANEGQAVVNCHFCHEEYTFSREDLEVILALIEANEE